MLVEAGRKRCKRERERENGIRIVVVGVNCEGMLLSLYGFKEC